MACLTSDGPSNRSKVLLSATLEAVFSVDASPFNVLLLHAAVASDMVRAAPTVPALPWIEPDTTTEHDGLATLLPICRSTSSTSRFGSALGAFYGGEPAETSRSAVGWPPLALRCTSSI